MENLKCLKYSDNKTKTSTFVEVHKSVLSGENMAFNGHMMWNKLYKSSDLRFLLKSLDKDEQSKHKVSGRKELIMTGSERSDIELQ